MSESLQSRPQSSAGHTPALHLVHERSSDVSALREQLQIGGYVVSAYDVSTAARPLDEAPAVIVCVADVLSSDLEVALTMLLEAYAPKKIPIIGVLPGPVRAASPVFDTILFGPVHPVQILNRINALIRLRRMETALVLRKQTLAQDFNITLPPPKNLLGVPFRILFVGTASPEFMSILNALQEKNVEVYAAFTSFSAFDYLHEKNFDAVVLNAVESLEPAMSISETMRRNPRLFHVPTLVMAKDKKMGIGEKAIRKGARDVLYAGASKYEICGRILELANFYRIHGQLKKELADIDGRACLDADTGLFHRNFIFSHLDRVAKSLAQTGDALSVLLLRVRPSATEAVTPESISKAITQVGSMLNSLVRAEDITGRMSEDIFVIAFPEQSRDSVKVVGKRIMDIVDCAAFDTGLANSSPMTLEVETLLSEKMDHESSDMFLTRSEAELTGGTITALTG